MSAGSVDSLDDLAFHLEVSQTSENRDRAWASVSGSPLHKDCYVSDPGEWWACTLTPSFPCEDVRFYPKHFPYNLLKEYIQYDVYRRQVSMLVSRVASDATECRRIITLIDEEMKVNMPGLRESFKMIAGIKSVEMQWAAQPDGPEEAWNMYVSGIDMDLDT